MMLSLKLTLPGWLLHHTVYVIPGDTQFPVYLVTSHNGWTLRSACNRWSHATLRIHNSVEACTTFGCDRKQSSSTQFPKKQNTVFRAFVLSVLAINITSNVRLREQFIRENFLYFWSIWYIHYFISNFGRAAHVIWLAYCLLYEWNAVGYHWQPDRPVWVVWCWLPLTTGSTPLWINGSFYQ